MTTKKDIVSRLRECDQGLLEEYQEPELGDIVTDCSSIAEAANLIEQRRSERDELRKQLFEVDEAEENAQLRIENALRSERDEARREVCELTMPCDGSQKGYAKGRGWDCFKEDNHNA